MLIGDPNLGFIPPLIVAPVPGVPGDLSTARFTGNTKTFPVTSRLRGLSYDGTSIYVGGENELRRYDGNWGGPLSSFSSSHSAYVSLNYPTIVSAKILIPDLDRIFWTNSSKYAYSAVIPYNNISSPSPIGTNTSFTSRVTTLNDMAWDRYGEFCYMTDSSASKRIMRFDISTKSMDGTTTPPLLDQLGVSSYGTPYCSQLNMSGTRLFVAVVKANGRAAVVRFNLPTAYSLTGATFHSTTGDLDAGIVIPGGLAIGYDPAGRDDAIMLVGDRDSKTVYEYSMSP